MEDDKKFKIEDDQKNSKWKRRKKIQNGRRQKIQNSKIQKSFTFNNMEILCLKSMTRLPGAVPQPNLVIL